MVPAVSMRLIKTTASRMIAPPKIAAPPVIVASVRCVCTEVHFGTQVSASRPCTDQNDGKTIAQRKMVVRLCHSALGPLRNIDGAVVLTFGVP
jgi:hypothetical protein